MSENSDPIDLSKLRPPALADAEKISKLAQLRACDSCENSFATLYMWSFVYGTQILEWKDLVIVYNPKYRLIHFPLGRIVNAQELKYITDAFLSARLIEKSGKYAFIYNLPPDYLTLYPQAAEFFDILKTPDEADYVYDVQKLVDSSGPKLRKKRNHIKHFVDSCPDFVLEPVLQSNLVHAFDFALELNAAAGLEDESKALNAAAANFKALGLEGIALYCPKKQAIVAMAVFSALNPEIYTVHFEKSLKDAVGAPQMIVQREAAAIAALGGKRMNREQDLGVENLRRAKESLDPLYKYERARAVFK